MPTKGGLNDAVAFWESVAETFGSNDHVAYELYNEPHNNDVTEYINGSSTKAGMKEMAAAVRKHSKDSLLVVAGAQGYAYDASSLLELDRQLESSE